MPKWQFSKKYPLCHFGTVVPVHRFQKLFWLNDFGLSIMKDYLHTFAQSFPHRISKITFVLCRGDDFGSLENRVRMGAYFWYLNF